MGAYFAATVQWVDRIRLGLPLVYRTPLMHAKSSGNVERGAIGPYRGAARAASYIAERLVTSARQLKFDRVELRRRNLIPVSAIPYKTPSGSSTTAASSRP